MTTREVAREAESFCPERNHRAVGDGYKPMVPWYNTISDFALSLEYGEQW